MLGTLTVCLWIWFFSKNASLLVDIIIDPLIPIDTQHPPLQVVVMYNFKEKRLKFYENVYNFRAANYDWMNIFLNNVKYKKLLNHYKVKILVNHFYSILYQPVHLFNPLHIVFYSQYTHQFTKNLLQEILSFEI